jgi:hypothetical protein
MNKLNPEKWGNGAWFMIFIIIFRLGKDNNEDRIELLKLILYKLCKCLPCDCRYSAIENIQKNNIMSRTDVMIILRFFVDLRNTLALKKDPLNPLVIDRKYLNEKTITLKVKSAIFLSFCIELEEITPTRIRLLNMIKEKIYHILSIE